MQVLKPKDMIIFRGLRRRCLLPSNDKRISSCGTRHVIYLAQINPKSKIENPQERALIRGVASQIEN
ncbi:hypothetical protein QUB27_29290, partial [Microcoleus sp. AT8-B6]